MFKPEFGGKRQKESSMEEEGAGRASFIIRLPKENSALRENGENFF